jgi:hypothetical protein
MEYQVHEANSFPKTLQELLSALGEVAFFEDSALVGSWVKPLYRDLFGIAYP